MGQANPPLVRIIGGEERPTAGRIAFGDRDWSPADDWSRVAIVHQEPQLFPNLTVAENLMVGREGPTQMRPVPSLADREVMASFGLARSPIGC
jgi:ABC-type sugar transport system ATPase subunit